MILFQSERARFSFFKVTTMSHNFLLNTEECIRVENPLSLEDARRLLSNYIEHYNKKYATPADKLMGRDLEIFKERNKET